MTLEQRRNQFTIKNFPQNRGSDNEEPYHAPVHRERGRSRLNCRLVAFNFQELALSNLPGFAVIMLMFLLCQVNPISFEGGKNLLPNFVNNTT